MPRPKTELSAAKVQEFEQMFLAGEDLHEITIELATNMDRIKKMAAAMPLDKKMIRHRAVTILRRGGTRWDGMLRRREPSPAAWADRDRRFREPRTLTAEFFGDPRPGQSALDKMQASA